MSGHRGEDDAVMTTDLPAAAATAIAATRTTTSVTTDTAAAATARTISNSTTAAPVTATIPKGNDTATDERSSESTDSSVPIASMTKTSSDSSKYITELGPDDVLLGRGAPIINYVGNVKFRSLVRSRKNDYITSGRHKIKDKVAKSIMKEIQRRGGRFLKRVETSKKGGSAAHSICRNKHQTTNSSSDDGGTSSQAPAQHPQDVKVYQIADYEIALEKVKQALRDKDTEQQQHQQQTPPYEASTAATTVSQHRLEEAAAASGIATLTALQRQLYDRLGQTTTLSNNSDILALPDAMNRNITDNLFPLSSVPSLNFPHGHDNYSTAASSEFMRYQQLQALPATLQERLINNERIKLLNQQLHHQQQQQDQQRLLAMLRQGANITNSSGNHNKSFQQPIPPETVMTSLLQRSNNPVIPNTGRFDGNIDVEGYLLHRQQLRNNDLLSSLETNNRKNMTTRDILLMQQLPNVSIAQNPISIFSSNNRLSQATANLLAHRQYDQYSAALQAHSLSLNETRTTPSHTNNNFLNNNTSRTTHNDKPDHLLLTSNVLGAPMLSDTIGSIRSTSKKTVSETLPLLTSGRIAEQHETTLTSMVSVENIKKTKRKLHDDDRGNSLSPRSSTTGSTNQSDRRGEVVNNANNDEASDTANHKKRSKLK